MKDAKGLLNILSAAMLLLLSFTTLSLNSKVSKLSESVDDAKALDEKSSAVIDQANKLFECINKNDQACFASNVTANSGLGAEWRIARDKFKDSLK